MHVHSNHSFCQTASFVWLSDQAVRRNQFVRFERTFHLASAPTDFVLHLFADTRYRLRVNGSFVAVGPGRFVTQYPEFDTHPIAPLLKLGANHIAVEVNFYGASSFQSMPDGQPGFIAWGGNNEVDLSTPGGWVGFRLSAWRSDAPLFSFAQNPVEICDTRLSDAGIETPLVTLEKKTAPWGALTPYSGPPIPYFPQYPKQIALVGEIKNEERRIGLLASKSAGLPRTAFATWIFSPRAQNVRLSCFWSTLFCNGDPVQVDTNTPFGNHGYCTLSLNKNWNLLAGWFEALTESWSYCLGVPYSADLSLHGRRNVSCREPLAVLQNAEGSALPSPNDVEPPAGWRLHDGNPQEITPARMMAWDRVSQDALHDLPMERLPEVSTIHAAEATWCFSFAGEFLGHLVLDVEGPAGTLMDVACDDWQTPDGNVALYQTNPFLDTADRFILRGGRQTVELFHPRGGKYVQVTLRAPDKASLLSLHHIYIRSRQTLGLDQTRFSCNHAVFNWVWPVAIRTLQASTDESYSDSPWRERGAYIGDSYVNLHIHSLFSSDLRVARRTLRLFAQAQLPNGQLACCAPAWLRKAHEDFTLIWLLALHDLWSFSSDTRLVNELWPVVLRIWESTAWEHHASGLWNADGKHLFIDWGVLESERRGEGNATLNLLRFGAAKACARLASALGLVSQAGRFMADAERTESRLLELLWDEEKGRLRASIGSATPALHANILALAFAFGRGDIRTRIIASLEAELRTNLRDGLKGDDSRGHLELYFLHFALPALAEHGRPDLAELLVKQHYGLLRSLGEDTLPETFRRVVDGGSRCHSWSGAVAIYAARYILGIRQTQPGNPRRLIFAPIVHNIKYAEGRIAHLDGWIEVSWHRENGELCAHIEKPQSVQIVRQNHKGKFVYQ